MARKQDPFNPEEAILEDLNQFDLAGLVEFLKGKENGTVRTWNLWRKQHHYTAVDLHGANLANADLTSIDLRGANLEGVTLNRAHLEKSILIRARLGEVRAQKAWLRGAIANWADFRGANFRDAHLEGADLRDASLDGAVLHGAHLEEANIAGASFANADLRRAMLRDVALSTLAKGKLRGVKLYQTYFSGALSLRYPQFLQDEDNPRSASTIWEDVQGRYSEAKDVYKSLKGYFEDVGDYGGANWAYAHEQQMDKLASVPAWARGMYPRRKWQIDANGHSYWKPNPIRWLGLELSHQLAGYGLSLAKPLIWLGGVLLAFALIYWIGGMLTAMPECSFAELRVAPRPGCAPTASLVDAIMFSLGAMTTIDVGTVQPYVSHVGLLAAVEALLGIAMTGLFGFVLGNKLRNS